MKSRLSRDWHRVPRTPEQQARRAMALAPINFRTIERKTWAGVLIEREGAPRSTSAYTGIANSKTTELEDLIALTEE